MGRDTVTAHRRSFIGIPVGQLPASGEFSLHYPSPNLRWVKPANRHVTLAFLGNQPTDILTHIGRLIAGIAQKHPSFSVQSQALQPFPDRRSPILALTLDEPPPLHQLKTAVDESLRELGIVPESRPFRPHITLARSKPFSPLPTTPLARVIRIRELVLYQSQTSPAGSIYTALTRHRLDGATPVTSQT